MTNRMTTDVLVLGAGAAGIRAAVRACETGSDVIVVAKEKAANGGSSFSPVTGGWGMQALTGCERTPERMGLFYQDIIHVGLGACDSELARILVEESAEAFQDLVSYGLAFRKDDNGNYIREKGCFSVHKRAFLTDSLANIRSSFQSAFSKSGAKTVVGRAVRLLVADSACFGALVVAKDGTSVEIRSRATVLATGGGAGLFEEHSVGESQTGDGIALAIDAGAKIVNMEFIQFMLGLKSGAEKRFLPRRKLRDLAVLTDCEGRDLPAKEIEDEGLRARALKERLGHAPFSSRDASCLVDRSIARANRNGGAYFHERKGDGNGEKNGSTRTWKVVHLAHAFNGGVKIDASAQSSAPGLFAAGEAAAGPHGADRIGGCMMTATQVFGKRAGFFASKRAKEMKNRPWPEIQSPEASFDRKNKGKKPSGELASQEKSKIMNRIKRRLTEHAGVLRSEKGLSTCLAALDDAKLQLENLNERRVFSSMDYYEIDHAITAARSIARSACRRKTSLGSHFREDDRTDGFFKADQKGFFNTAQKNCSPMKEHEIND